MSATVINLASHASRSEPSLLEAFIEASLDARAHGELAREFLRIADAFREKAIAHYRAADACLDGAERCAKLLARHADEDPCDERGLRARLNERDEGEAGA